jgi:hypothetical protein
MRTTGSKVLMFAVWLVRRSRLRRGFRHGILLVVELLGIPQVRGCLGEFFGACGYLPLLLRHSKL